MDRPLPKGIRSLLDSQYAEIKEIDTQIQDLEGLFEADGPQKKP